MTGRASLLTVMATSVALVALRSAGPPRNVLTWDVFGYYLYLPATFIHHDPGLRDHAWLDEVMATYDPSSTLYQLVDGTDGDRVIKYPMGMAVFYAPFFFVAHAVAGLSGYPADGFSPPYQYIVAYGCLLWCVLGLVIFRRVLLHWFNDRWSSIILLLIVFGTNYLQLAVIDGTLLTHTLLFTLYALLLLGTIRWHERPNARDACLVGASIGLITLVRPSEIVCVLIPLLWLPSGPAGWGGKFDMLLRNWRHVVLMVVCAALVVSPQLFYWHARTGQWLFYSYQNPGEGFELLHPYLAEYLFSFRKGWLLYTPIMVVALVGIIVLWKQRRDAFHAVLLFLLADLWVVASWSTWWYAGGSFSARSMVPAYALLALPLGHSLRTIARSRRPRLIGSVGISALVLLNLFQTWQWHAGILSKERMTRAYYFAIFARTRIPSDADDLLLVERSATAEEHFTREKDYEARELARFDFADQPDGRFELNAEVPYSPGPHLTFREITAKDHAWLRIGVRLLVSDAVAPPPVVVATFHHDGCTYKYRTATWKISRNDLGCWVDLSLDYLTPEVRSKDDDLKIYVWNEHGGRWAIDDLVVTAFEPLDR